MIELLEDLRSKKNPKARIKLMRGHFATANSHINTYIDMSTVKVRHNNARETAKVLASEYVGTTAVDTIVCMEGTEVIGTFMAMELSDMNQHSLSRGTNISIVSPEVYMDGQIVFRDNKQRMIKDMQVLVLAASVTTGKSVTRALESIQYYGGNVCGVCSIFSSVSKVDGIPVKTIFSTADLPDYHAYKPGECPMCNQGIRLDAIVNSYGYSKLQ